MPGENEVLEDVDAGGEVDEAAEFEDIFDSEVDADANKEAEEGAEKEATEEGEAEEAEEKPTEEESETTDDNEDVEPDTEPEEEEADPDPEEEEEEEVDEKDLTPQAKAEKAGKTLLQKLGDMFTSKKDDEDEPESKEPDKETKPDVAPADEKKSPVPTEAEINAFFDKIPEGAEKDELREFHSDYPVAFKASIAAGKYHEASPSGDKATNDRLDALETANKDLLDQNQQLQQGMQVQALFTELQTRGHTDAYKISQSDKFNEWREKQTEGMQALATSWEVDNAELVLNAFKADMAKKTKKKVQDKDTEKKKKTDDLHKSSVKPGKQAQRTKDAETPAEEKSEFEDAFDKA